MVIRKPNGWITHVKQFAVKNKMSYSQAIKNPQCKAGYKRISGKRGIKGGSLNNGEVFGILGSVAFLLLAIIGRSFYVVSSDIHDDDMRRVVPLNELPPVQADAIIQQANDGVIPIARVSSLQELQNVLPEARLVIEDIEDVV
jgi:hypothetical protein